MRKLAIEDGLTVRFPARCETFDQGVEIGILACLMALRYSEFSREISQATVEQAEVLARNLGYHLSGLEFTSAEICRVTFRQKALKAKLRLVASA